MKVSSLTEYVRAVVKSADGFKGDLVEVAILH